MFDLDRILHLIIGVIFFIIIGAMVGAIIYLWIVAAPLLAKIFWTIIFVSLMLVFIAMTLMVIEC